MAELTVEQTIPVLSKKLKETMDRLSEAEAKLKAIPDGVTLQTHWKDRLFDGGYSREVREQMDRIGRHPVEYRLRGLPPPGDPNDTAGIAAMRAIRSVAIHKLGETTAEKFLKEQTQKHERDFMWQRAYEHVQKGRADQEEYAKRSLSVADASAGGAWVPDDMMAQEFIPLLRDVAVVRKAGAVVVDIPRGNTELPSQTGAAAAYWEGESQDVTASTPATGQQRLTARRLTGFVAASKEFLYSSALSVDQWLRNELLYVLALKEDKTFMIGDGSDGGPLGMFYTPGITVLTLGSGNGAIPDADTPGEAIQLAEANYWMRKVPAWFFTSRTKLAYRQQRFASGGWIYRDEMKSPNLARQSEGELDGIPYYRSEQIGNAYTVGTSTNCSIQMLVDMATFVIAEQGQVEIQVSTEGSYPVSGTLRSLLTRGEIGIMVTRRVDAKLTQAASTVVVEGLLPLA